MIEKTKGIVLHQLKYTDSGIVVQLYTEKFGRQTLFVKGMRNKKAGRHNILFQPLFILDIVIYYKESREIQTLKEFSVSYAPGNIHLHIKKSCTAIFLGEVLNSVLREESPHKELFNYLEDSIIYFDNCKTGFANFHIGFLTGLCRFLGFEPGRRNNKSEVFFDLINGKFVPVPPVHGNYVTEEISDILADFFSTKFDHLDCIELSGAKRNEVLETIIRYYSIHLPGLKKIKSLEVLKEIFR